MQVELNSEYCQLLFLRLGYNCHRQSTFTVVMSPKNSYSRYVVAVVVALLSVIVYTIMSNVPLAATSIELVTSSH